MRGAGAARGATVTVRDNGVVVGLPQTVATNGTSGGLFTISASLARGTHQLTVSQSVGGVTSATASFSMEVRDPNAPAPPQVSQPAADVVTGNGAVSVGGTATPGATVTVTAKPRDGGAAQTSTFTANSSGSWSGTVTLSPGSYDVTFTQTVAGVTGGAGPSVKVEVAIPRLAVTAPVDFATFSCAADGTRTCPVAVSGQGAGAGLGPVIAGDGNGDFFVDLSPTLGNTGGVFGGTVRLDYGRHVLKIFQRANGLDGEGVTRTVLVQPPVGALAITSPASGAVVDATLTVTGTGGLPRTGLPGTAIGYQGSTRLAEGPLDDTTGQFAIPVTLTGAGLQTLSVSQTARSLSGGGAAESAKTSISVRVRPPAPVIQSPVTGTQQPGSLIVQVTGTATPGATVTVYANGVARTPTTTATEAGTFSVTLAALPAGSYQLQATATLGGATGAASTPPTVIAVGDVTPPTVTVAGLPIVLPATDESGRSVDIAALVSATDGTTSLPASAIACAPAKSPVPRFPIGSTSVTCEAVDAAGNRGATTFTVTITSSAGPIITGTGLTAEAQGPDGAVVNYQVGARGYLADCASPESGETRACTSWTPKYKGLSFLTQSLSQNPNPGADEGSLYMLLGSDISPATGITLLKLRRGAAAWERLTPPGTSTLTQNDVLNKVVIGGGTPPVLYVASDDEQVERRGIQISPDGGLTWLSAVTGVGVGGIAGNPLDPTRKHFVAWRGRRDRASNPTAPQILETHDGWATWSFAAEGLPQAKVLTVALDTVNPGRMYASLEAAAGDLLLTRLFLRKDGGSWVPLPVPPLTGARFWDARYIRIAPTTDGCGQTQSFPTVFAGEIVSRNGGDDWTDLPTHQGAPFQVAFDRTNPCVVYGTDVVRFVKSTDGGRTFFAAGTGPEGPDQSEPFQDSSDPLTLYETDGLVGGRRSADGGQTWAPLPPAGMTPMMGIGDVAVDPVDPRIILASFPGGVFRSTDGGGSWRLGDGILDREQYVSRRLMIDGLQRNVAYAGFDHGYNRHDSAWSKSLDGGATWTALVNSAGTPAWGAVALDPVAANHWISVGDRNDGTDVLTIRDSVAIGGATGELLRTAAAAPGSGTPSSLLGIQPYGLQIVPDLARTLLLTWDRDPDIGGPDVNLFSFRDAEKATSTLPLEGGGLGRANVLYDGSDGTDRLFVDGGAIGKTPDVLYRTTVAEARRGPLGEAPWEPLGGKDFIGGFARLIIDPTSGGQSMYATGPGSALSESHDGGRTWQQDQSAPSSVSGIWLSPVDGGVYATLYGAYPLYYRTKYPDRFSPGLLFKREPSNGVPVGARIVLGDLRVTCTGPGPVDPNDGLPLRATAPGATFPLGDTTLTCTAKDVFGTPGTASLVIRVVDTTPPVITLDTPPAPAAAPAGGTAAVTFVVTANDAVDGPRPVTCTKASGSPFPIGITTVACTAADTGGRAASLSFPVVVSQADAPPLGAPSLSAPADATLEATGPTGASGAGLAVTAATSSGAPVVPACAPALASTFALGVTPVTCTATDTANALAVTRSFVVTVRDTTAPSITVPGDLAVAAEGAFGAHVSFATSASDLVDATPPPAVSCSPDSGAVFPIGATIVSCRAVDKAGNQAFAHFKVTVTDQGLPTLHLADTTADADGFTGTRVSYEPAPYATDISGNLLPIDCAPPTGTLLPLGDTTVSCTATGGTGREARGSFTVHVVDRSPPTVTVPGTITLEAAGPAGAAAAFAAEARDLVTRGVLVPTCRRTTGFGLPTPVASGAVFPIGDNPVTCSATDETGNVGAASFLVVVRDTTPPALTLPAPITVAGDGTDSAVVTFPATAVDTVSGDVGVACSPPSGGRFVVGTTTVTCVARDAAGNESRGSFTVTVTVSDTTGPVLTVPPDLTITNCTSSPNIGIATATDAASPPVTITSDKPATFKAGTTVVTYTARDARGNVTTGTQRVTVALGDDASCCPAGTHVIKGTSNNDTLTGTSGRDCILGFGGQDVINGGGGDDVISGGDGDDVIDGGSGNDQNLGRVGPGQAHRRHRQRLPRRRRRRRRLSRRRRRRHVARRQRAGPALRREQQRPALR